MSKLGSGLFTAGDMLILGNEMFLAIKIRGIPSGISACTARCASKDPDLDVPDAANIPKPSLPVQKQRIQPKPSDATCSGHDSPAL